MAPVLSLDWFESKESVQFVTLIEIRNIAEHLYFGICRIDGLIPLRNKDAEQAFWLAGNASLSRVRLGRGQLIRAIQEVYVKSGKSNSNWWFDMEPYRTRFNDLIDHREVRSVLFQETSKSWLLTEMKEMSNKADADDMIQLYIASHTFWISKEEWDHLLASDPSIDWRLVATSHFHKSHRIVKLVAVRRAIEAVEADRSSSLSSSNGYLEQDHVIRIHNEKDELLHLLFNARRSNLAALFGEEFKLYNRATQKQVEKQMKSSLQPIVLYQSSRSSAPPIPLFLSKRGARK